MDLRAEFSPQLKTVILVFNAIAPAAGSADVIVIASASATEQTVWKATG